MAYSFHNQNMSTLSNVLVIHTALDKDKLPILPHLQFPVK